MWHIKTDGRGRRIISVYKNYSFPIQKPMRDLRVLSRLDGLPYRKHFTFTTHCPRGRRGKRETQRVSKTRTMTSRRYVRVCRLSPHFCIVLFVSPANSPWRVLDNHLQPEKRDDPSKKFAESENP